MEATKFRFVLINGRGYSLQFIITCSLEEAESIRDILSEAEGLILVRMDVNV